MFLFVCLFEKLIFVITLFFCAIYSDIVFWQLVLLSIFLIIYSKFQLEQHSFDLEKHVK